MKICRVISRSILFSLVLLCSIIATIRANAAESFNVRTLGAVGNGQTNDTAAFQKALDQCAAAGGGEVIVPAGDYLIGSIELKSYTTLRLARDATLRGSS